LFIIPYGDVQVDTSRADGIILADDGHFEITRNGVFVKLTTTVSNLGFFVQAVQTTYPNGSVNISEDGSLEISKSGNTLLVRPDLVNQANSIFTVGILQNASNQKIFQTLNREQTLFPHFYDLNQLKSTFVKIDPNMVLRDNLNGTVTATINGSNYLLTPTYEVLSAIGGIPPENRNDPWWVSNGTIYFKYSNGSAQGFTIQ
jgi:hypothetical protein